MRVDRLHEDDWTRLRDVRLRALTEDADAFGSSLERESSFAEQHWRMRVRASPWFVAVVREAPAGVVSVIREPGAPDDERHVVGLWVAPEHRGTGVGDGLLRAARAWAAADGAATLTLWSLDGSAHAERLYRRAGFAPTGEATPYGRDPSRTEVRWATGLEEERAALG